MDLVSASFEKCGDSLDREFVAGSPNAFTRGRGESQILIRLPVQMDLVRTSFAFQPDQALAAEIVEDAFLHASGRYAEFRPPFAQGHPSMVGLGGVAEKAFGIRSQELLA
ncbi:MAG: hypothetical protein IT364_01855 [Candidatus Hydrogenedentes bacterium]|nr:hypothetical protein [Candidatus Hydrogenedentota bacterium]